MKKFIVLFLLTSCGYVSLPEKEIEDLEVISVKVGEEIVGGSIEGALEWLTNEDWDVKLDIEKENEKK